MSAPGILLPGDTITAESIPWSQNKQLKLGPGLQQLSPTTYKVTAGGLLQGDSKKRTAFIENGDGRVRFQSNPILPIS